MPSPKNIDIVIEGDIVTIKIDLRKGSGLSSTGKSELIATTSGNLPIPGRVDYILGINCFKPIKKGEPE